jgi:hypothetical protein
MFVMLANLVMTVHFAILAFMALGGLLAFTTPWIAWLQVPTFIYAALIGIYGWSCPLTGLEHELRQRAGQDRDRVDFVEFYIMPVLYPKTLFPGGYPRHDFALLCALVVSLNVLIYSAVIWA